MRRVLATVALTGLLAGCTATTPPPAVSAVSAAPASAAEPSEASVPTGQQWLYGSAEGMAVARQTYDALTRYALAAASNRPATSVIVDEVSGGFVPCGDKPLAVVFDADETLIWNLGAMRWFAEKGTDFDVRDWTVWERTGAGKAQALPGAIEAVNALRAAGITVVANTNRTAPNAEGTEATLAAAGLGAFKHGETLFLMGDDAGGSSKDPRRATIASRFCVVAMAGDQLGDFRQAFNDPALSPRARKQLAAGEPFASLWGRGWFVLPNPVYGPSLRGDFEAVFPPETRWTPNQGSE